MDGWTLLHLIFIYIITNEVMNMHVQEIEFRVYWKSYFVFVFFSNLVVDALNE
jgi:hypothetical protein